MADQVGSVYFDTILDGRSTPRQAQEIGDKAGQAGGKQYSDSFEKLRAKGEAASTKKSVSAWAGAGSDAGKQFGSAFNRGFDGDLTKKMQGSLAAMQVASSQTFGKMRDDVDRVKISADDLGSAFRLAMPSGGDSFGSYNRDLERVRVSMDDLNRSFPGLSRAVESTSIRFNSARDSATDFAQKLAIAANRANDAGDRIAGSFGKIDLSHNARQVVFWTTAIIASLEELAVLGSAAGAGLVAVGAGAAQGILGAGALITAFTQLNKELDELPASMRQTASEFQSFKSAAKGVVNTISEPAFKEMGGAFTDLSSTIAGLSPELSRLGASAGRVFKDFASNMKPGTEAFAELQQLMSNSASGFTQLSGSVGSFGLSLLRAMNGAQPLVQQMYGWIDKLAQRFDAFTSGNGLNLWVANAQVVFSSFGGLVDAVGRSLNDMVTADSVARTKEFLDNLTGFMPSATRLADVVGKLDAFGLLAEMLNEFGQALEPLAAPAAELAEALNRVASEAIEGLSSSLKLFSAVAGPAASALADLINAMPDGSVALAVGALATAFITLRSAKALSGLASVVTGAVTSMAQIEPTATRGVGAVGKLSSALGKAGLVGAAIAGVAGLGAALKELDEDIRGVDRMSRNYVETGASVAEAMKGMSASGVELTGNLDDITGHVGDLGNFWVWATSTMTDTGTQAMNLATTLQQLDGPLTAMANRDMSAAVSQFQAYANELGVSGEKTMVLISQMPGFEQALINQAGALGIAATDANLVSLAMGEMSLETAGASSSVALQEAALATLEGRAVSSGQQIDGLSDKIRNFGSATLDARSAEREFEAAVDDASAAIMENGGTLDIQTAQGRANERALDDLARSTLDLAAATAEQTGDQQAATAQIQRGRDALIQQLGQLGITGQAAQDYANKLGLIPGNVKTAVNIENYGSSYDRLMSIQAQINAIPSQKNVRIAVTGGQGGITFASGGLMDQGVAITKLASGSILRGPRMLTPNIQAGEAGMEAVVPLQRALNQVDPSVRPLAAFAQGKYETGGTTISVVIQPGAIVVDGAGDPEMVGEAVVDALMAKVSG